MSAKEAAFQENRENRISYEELRKLAAYQRQDGQPSKEMAKVKLYASGIVPQISQRQIKNILKEKL